MIKSHFDYIIIGNGLAGLQLALAFSKDSYFKSKQIALIDPDHKTHNDKTWSFWEKGEGKWETIVLKTWAKTIFNSKEQSIPLNFKDYTYKTIRSLDFYTAVITHLKKNNNFHFIYDEVKQLDQSNPLKVTCTTEIFSANKVFDSRIPDEFYKQKTRYTLINQHFKGIVIETDSSYFDPVVFTMMDYRLQYKNTTSFVYILPFSSHKALIEYTFFTPDLIDPSVYDQLLNQYIKEKLKISQFKILDSETGNIPMTNFPFEKYHTHQVTKIGTAGGWVKGSTGYSFKHTEKKVMKILENIKSNKKPSKGLLNKRFKFYDKIFLKVLQDENNKGPWIFKQFYEKNSTEIMFRFLDEESSFKEELSIMYSLFSWSFIKAFFKTLSFLRRI